MSKTFYHPVLVGLMLAATEAAPGAETPARFLGANSCASSSCHGGGGAKQNQFLVWSLKDSHAQRPVASLTTARSKQIAEALEIKDSAASPRCTLCHAPLDSVPQNLRDENFQVGEGVSCESCHGPAEPWLRGHTRTDWTRADRTAAGMRDLQNLYVRANVCVACHQNVDADILKAGHPELIFELDGQSVAEPKHWRADKNGNGAQAWLVGQAVALRELSWLMTKEHPMAELSQRMTETNLLYRIYATEWLLRKATGEHLSATTMAEDFEAYQRNADKLAQEKSKLVWTDQMTRKCLMQLAATSEDFLNEKVPATLQARRTERLVLALDRLVAALPDLKNNQPAQSALNQLFQLAQSVPEFDPKQFSAALEKFAAALAAP